LAPITLVKLGGSLITDKAKPFSYRGEVVSSLGGEIAASGQGVVLVHGGGSFGHTVAKEYGLSSSSYSRAGRGVSRTRAAMYELNQLVCRSLIEAGVEPYPFSPYDILSAAPTSAARSWILRLLSAGLSPTTFGDVSSYARGFRVLSGDTIMYELARILKPERCVFAMDVDGLYRGEDKTLLPKVSRGEVQRLKVGRADDATGGIKPKLKVAAKIAAMGIRVGFVSGFRTSEFAKCLKGLDFYGTVVG